MKIISMIVEECDAGDLTTENVDVIELVSGVTEDADALTDLSIIMLITTEDTKFHLF